MVDILDPSGVVQEEGAKVHVHDPGRLKELIYPGSEVLVRKASDPDRKTGWDLLAARYEREWILINSAFHRRIMDIVLGMDDISPFGKLVSSRPEVRYGASRMDYLLEPEEGGNRVLVETKGCTLTIDGEALFPDAPTTRGKRHVEELMSALDEGYRSAIVVLCFRPDSLCFRPKEDTDPDFSRTFYQAREKGVEVYPLLFRFTGEWVEYIGPIPVCG